MLRRWNRASRCAALSFLCLSLAGAFSSSGLAPVHAQESTLGPFLATGIKIGEVRSDSAIVRVRLTLEPQRRSGPVTGDARKMEDAEFASLEGATPGVEGSLRVVWWPPGRQDLSRATPWQTVDVRTAHSASLTLAGLRAGMAYDLRVETRGVDGSAGASLTGKFTTAAPPDVAQSVRFTVITGQAYRHLDDREGFLIYDSMARLQPSFLVATGDTVYYDNDPPLVTSEVGARFHWQRMDSLPRHRAFYARVPGYWMKDDHDIADDDCWPSKRRLKVAPFTFEDGLRVFRSETPQGPLPYRSVRWGKNLEVWFVEGREFRSANSDPDGPGKTIWGAEQIEWLKASLAARDATFRVLVSATPIVGPDRASGKRDNHSNASFRREGRAFRHWARETLGERFYLVCGDRHWQYVSQDPETALVEFSCGPASDIHSGGSPGFDEDYHRFHRVKGGFLEVQVSETSGVPWIAFRLRAVDGEVAYEHREDAFDSSALAARGLAAKPAPTAVYDALLAQVDARLEAREAELVATMSAEAVVARRDEVRERIQAAIGAFPERTPLEARVVERIDRGDHRLEKLVFESRPGFRVTANLWLPGAGVASPPYPAVLFPCGHSENGKAGSTYQTAGQEFARRGLATLIYDPIGQGERFQFLDRDGKPIVGGTTEHTLTGASALLVGSHVANVLIWDGIRAVDYLATRDDIDLARLGLTGNSGGGTQSAYLMALEPRILAAAPSCYLTSFSRLFHTIGPQDAEQNLSAFIARGLDHADFVHAFAPRPALLCAATDDFFDISGTWSTFRELKRVYGRLDAAERVDLIEADGKHGYQPRIRQRVGRFFEAELLQRAPGEIVPMVTEGEVLADEVLACTETQQVLSSFGGRSVADLWRERERELSVTRRERFESSSREEWVAGVLDVARMDPALPFKPSRRDREATHEGLRIERLLSNVRGQPVSALFVVAGKTGPRGRVVIATDGEKESRLAEATGLARKGEAVLLVDLPGFGETRASASNRSWGDDWQLAFLSFHLDTPLAGLRADALRSACSFLRIYSGDQDGKAPVRVLASGRAAVPGLLAALADPAISLRIEDGLVSWSLLVADGLHQGRLGNIVPHALEHFDLPMLVEHLGERVDIVRPRGPNGAALEALEF